MSILFFDTETSGLYNKKLAPDDPNQAHLMEIGAVLTSDYDPTNPEHSLQVLSHLSCYVTVPETTIVHPKAFAATGLSVAKVNTEGIPLADVLRDFSKLVYDADTIAGHNLDFDINIMDVAYRLAKLPEYFLHIEGAAGLDNFVKYDTMRESVDICKLPGRYGYKWPKLIEAYQILVDTNGFEDAHSALADIKATIEIYKALKDRVPM